MVAVVCMPYVSGPGREGLIASRMQHHVSMYVCMPWLSILASPGLLAKHLKGIQEPGRVAGSGSGGRWRSGWASHPGGPACAAHAAPQCLCSRRACMAKPVSG